MKRKERGVFERPLGSGIWWINYYVRGVQHREKVGRKSDAIDLYRIRKADAIRGRKLPELQPGKIVTFGHLLKDAIDYAEKHLRTKRDYVSKKQILEDEGWAGREASGIKPEDIERWITKHGGTSATKNRYRSFFSLCFNLGVKAGKISQNPARSITKWREDNARLRFLSRDEYSDLVNAIKELHPDQLPTFNVSIYTGMRWGEQFSLTWSQVHFDRAVIRLIRTKNGKPRNVPLNSAALAALEEQQKLVAHKPGDPVFPLGGPTSTWRWWFQPCLDKAKIKDYVWHSNRHTFCSWLAMAGASIKEIQELAGHLDIAMSARYAHLSPDHVALASERLVQA